MSTKKKQEKKHRDKTWTGKDTARVVWEITKIGAGCVVMVFAAKAIGDAIVDTAVEKFNVRKK